MKHKLKLFILLWTMATVQLSLQGCREDGDGSGTKPGSTEIARSDDSAELTQSQPVSKNSPNLNNIAAAINECQSMTKRNGLGIYTPDCAPPNYINCRCKDAAYSCHKLLKSKQIESMQLSISCEGPNKIKPGSSQYPTGYYQATILMVKVIDSKGQAKFCPIDPAIPIATGKVSNINENLCVSENATPKVSNHDFATNFCKSKNADLLSFEVSLFPAIVEERAKNPERCVERWGSEIKSCVSCCDSLFAIEGRSFHESCGSKCRESSASKDDPYEKSCVKTARALFEERLEKLVVRVVGSDKGLVDISSLNFNTSVSAKTAWINEINGFDFGSNSVTLTASPKDMFKQWDTEPQGICEKTNTPTTCTFKMPKDEDATVRTIDVQVTAIFNDKPSPTKHKLTLKKSGIEGYITAFINNKWVQCRSTSCQPIEIESSNPHTKIEVTAIGKAKIKWTGCTEQTNDNLKCSATMTSDLVVEAEFSAKPTPTYSPAPNPTPTQSVAPAPTTFTLTRSIKGGSGTRVIKGTINNQPISPTCNQDACLPVHNITKDLIVTLTAEPQSSFSGWIGCSSNNTTDKKHICSVLMDKNKSVTANFSSTPAPTSPNPPTTPSAPTTPSKVTLTVSREVSGTVISTHPDYARRVNCGYESESKVCDPVFNVGDYVILEGRPKTGFVLIGWDRSDAAARQPPQSTRINFPTSKAISVKAIFAPIQTSTPQQLGTLEVIKTGDGYVKTKQGRSIDCGETCRNQYSAGTITLEASSTSSSAIRWSGCVARGLECDVSVRAGSKSDVYVTFGR